ncbi:High-affinity gluconate transporter GntT [Klebsiella pneumoniae]|uniref:High-affinity gluconate transporter GntT n=1 Tax=Klebsiella pneumoniae TaxID=573 RepID=A0A2X3DKV1_KLEPN|nr:High-affinity gluconate transporter GntT [Klebsiella pneumoniae]
MPLVIVAIGVALLLLLMIRFKMNGFIALVLVALAVGLMQGMPLDKVIVSIKNGVGGTLGSLALIMGFGAMLGKLLADCGGAQRIATTLINKSGKKHIQWAVVLTGFTVGFALFYEVGFVLMLPLVFTIAASARIPLLYVGVPMAAALSVTHGFLPPHPGPAAIATIFHADMGKTLLYGTILAIPTVILAGPVFARFLKGIDKPIPEGLHNPKVFTEEEMPGFGVSVWTSLVPVILMAMRAVAEMILPKGHAFLPIAEFFGDPVMATLIAVLIALFTFGLNRGRSMEQINDTLTSSIKIIAMMLLIIGGGGAFKQVLVDSGMDKYIASIMHESNMSPLFMAWSIAAVLRIALGSATVAAITAGGIAAPLIATTGVSPELMVIAVGSGSVIFSHVNDPGFWLFKEYFNLTIGETIKSWSGAGNHYLSLRPGGLSAAGDGGVRSLSPQKKAGPREAGRPFLSDMLFAAQRSARREVIRRRLSCSPPCAVYPDP